MRCLVSSTVLVSLVSLAVWLLSPAAGVKAAELDRARQLRAAVVDLMETFGGRYPLGRQFLDRLDAIEAEAAAAGHQQLQALTGQLETLRREALVANPLVSDWPVLFVVRHQYRKDHHNTATMFQTREINAGSFQGGGALKLIDLAHGGRARTLLELPDGVARDPDVRFDGKEILFSMRRDGEDDYHLYTLDVHDGRPGRLRQLTFGSAISDIDPIYLPSGQVLFASTREPKFCMCNRHIMGNLFTMNPDGSNLQQIGHSTLHEGHPALLPDGRVLYDRWEYVDRNFGDAQGVWIVNPDGTGHAIYYGNNTNSPGAVLDARSIPGTQQLISTFSSCHDRPWGALAVIDRRRGVDGREPVLRIWPEGAAELVGKGNYDTFAELKIKYEDPYPLSDKYFLCSRMTGRGDEMGIWLLDVFGNEVLLHAEGPGCFDPMPLRPRRAPPAAPPRVDLARDEGHFYVADVYQGTGMETVPRGTVKYLRVVESPEKRFWTQQSWNGSGTQAPAMAWDDFNNKRIIGTVPVQADGSAYFSVPAERFVYFQLLDDRGMMIQSMRSATIVRPGETAGCTGCHENRRSSVPLDPARLAMLGPPSRPQPWYGPPRTFGYAAEVQPVFDQHCVSCHDYGKADGRKLNLAGDLLLAFNTSYVELRRKGYVNVVGAGPHRIQQPKAWGSHTSRLVRTLVDGHGNAVIDDQINLSDEDFDRIVTWIDINAPYYPEYASAYRNGRYGRSPLAPAELDRLSQLVGVDLNEQGAVDRVNFTRPQFSPCLSNLAGPSDRRYTEALALIRSGTGRLAQVPRTDMPGFQLVDPTEISQQAKYDSLAREQSAMRKAIARGERRYEPHPGGGK